MIVTVEGFGVLRQCISMIGQPCSRGKTAEMGGTVAAIELQPGATVRDLVRTLALADGLVAMVTVNGVGRSLDHRLADGDDVKLIPPVSGG